MPNLNQIYALKQKYFHLNVSENKALQYIQLNEAKDNFEKGFNNRSINESFREEKLFSFVNNLEKPNIIKYFEEEREEEVVLLFVDISSFSKTISGFSTKSVKTYLDSYYKTIIPIIYNYGGEIEKLMGDGIIVVFGKPFMEELYPLNVYKAEECAKEMIQKFRCSDKNVKVAIHIGSITYYKVPGNYEEYTMIGPPITDLYRLESISETDSINFYSTSKYDKLGWKTSIFKEDTITNFKKFEVKLQGVDFTIVKSFCP